MVTAPSPYIDTEVIQSVDRENYKDSDFKALMKKIRRTRFLSKASLIIGSIGLLAFIVLHTPQRFFLTIFSFAVFFYVHYVAPVKLEYDFTDEQRAAYEEWYTAWRKLFACDTVYYVPETYTNSNAREHGGAEKTISEEKVLGMPNLPYYLRTNVPVFSVALNQRESFYIFPDKIFYIHNKNISAYDIAEVSFEVDSTNYVTDEAHLPADSKVVGNTWLNVNSDGSPDRRYKHNMPCLICEFGKLRISSDTGLDVLFLLSNADNVEQFKSILPQ